MIVTKKVGDFSPAFFVFGAKTNMEPYIMSADKYKE